MTNEKKRELLALMCLALGSAGLAWDEVPDQNLDEAMENVIKAVCQQLLLVDKLIMG